jgi:hypothetical protein
MNLPAVSKAASTVGEPKPEDERPDTQSPRPDKPPKMPPDVLPEPDKPQPVPPDVLEPRPDEVAPSGPPVAPR